ncbi:MAG: glucose-1-phosphate adenylyltransferase [Parachlamydiales bacterium]|nr:glucose-1-phosphate adenylyltransferase [Parachlamydiales bacterium]
MAADMKRVVAIVLGGGEGRRLFPLTATRCKPAVPFARYRLIDIPISNSLNSNIRKIFIISQFLSFSLHQHLLKTYQLDAFSSGFIEVLAPEQKPTKNVWFQGTADAIRQNLEYFIETPADYFLILAGDQLYNIEFEKMVQRAIDSGADLTVAAIPIDRSSAKRMGIFKVDDQGQVLDFIEKPENDDVLKGFELNDESMTKLGLPANKGNNLLASMGLYVFKRNALFKLLQEDLRDDFGKHLIPTQVKEGKVSLFLYNGYWEDIGTIDSFYRANLDLTGLNPGFNCYDESHIIYTAPNNLPGPKISCDKMHRTIVCEGSIVEAEEISHSILGARSLIQKGTIVRDSVIMGNDFYTPPAHEHQSLPSNLTIGEDCVIIKTIIDKNVSLGKGVRLINQQNLTHYDGPGVYIREGIIVVAKGATLPDGFTL